MAVLLEVGLHGIENTGTQLPVEENIYVMSAQKNEEAGITDSFLQLYTMLSRL